MRFWDSSAIVPLLVDGPQTSVTRSLLRADAAVAVWWSTRTECVSALARQVRDGTIEPRGEGAARTVLVALERTWSELQPSEAVRGTAERLLAAYPLRAADALQLAAAVQWRGDTSSEAQFVCFDGRLRGAAHAERFVVLPPDL